MLTQKKLKEYFSFNKDTGKLVWKKRKGHAKVGDIAGCAHSCGYWFVGFDGDVYTAHRLIWLYMYGYLPETDIDHINRDKKDNRLSNLREVSRQCNSRNQCLRDCNTSGVKGVHWNKAKCKWMAFMKVNYKHRFLGYYDYFDDAACARLAGEQCVDWDGCDSASPSYLYVKKNVQGK